MSWIELVVRFVVGGSLVALISLLAKSPFPGLAGVLVMFPAITVVGFSFLARTVSPASLRKATLFSLYSVPATILFLLMFYLVQTRLKIVWALTVSVGVWLVTAILLLALNTWVFHLK